MEFIFGLLIALLGVAALLYGYRLFILLLPVWGFLLGFLASAQIHASFYGTSMLSSLSAWILAIITGLIFGALAYLFLAVGIALIAFGFGAWLMAGITGVLGMDGFLGVILIMAGGFAAAVLVFVYNLQKHLITALMCIIGANLVVFGALVLFGQETLQALTVIGHTIRPVLQSSPLWLLVWAALAVAGFIFQFRMNKDWNDKRKSLIHDWAQPPDPSKNVKY